MKAPVVFLPADRFVGWLLEDAIETTRCTALLDDLVARGFERTGDRYPANYRNNDRLVFDDPALAKALYDQLGERLPRELEREGDRWELCGFNARFRACRYVDGQSFCIHRDGPFAPSEDLRSFLTLQLYLDDDPARAGGRTRFYADATGATTWASIEPRTGTAIVFDHAAWHDGEPVTAGIKHVLRTDAMYRRIATARVGTASDDVIGRHRGYAWHAIVLRDGSIASAGRDGTIRRWKNGDSDTYDLESGSITCLLEDTSDRIWCGTRAGDVCFDAVWVSTGLAAITSVARSGDLVAFTTARGEVVAFDTRDPRLPRWVSSAHAGWAWGIAAHEDGFLSCGHDGRVMRIDGEGRARVWAELANSLRAIAFDRHAVVGDERGWLHWLDRGQVIRSQRAHAAAVTSIAMGDDCVVSASEDGTVKRWRGAAEEVVIELADFVTSVAIDARGHVITAGYDGAIRRVPSSRESPIE